MAPVLPGPDALMSVTTSPVHSQDPSGHAADRVEKLRPIYLAARAIPVSLRCRLGRVTMIGGSLGRCALCRGRNASAVTSTYSAKPQAPWLPLGLTALDEISKNRGPYWI